MNNIELFKKVASNEINVQQAMELIKNAKNKRQSMIFDFNDAYVQDHLVMDQNILLGVTYCSIALDTIYNQTEKNKPVVLRNFYLKKPVIVTKGQKVEIRSNIQYGENESKIQILDDRNSSIAEAVFSKEKPSKIHEHIPTIEKLKNEAVQTIDEKEIYYQLKEVGVQFGPALHTVKKVWKGEGYVFTSLEKSDLLAEDFHTIHPAIIDGVIVGSLCTRVNEEKSTFIPLSIKEIQFYESPGNNCFCYSKIGKVNKEIIVFNSYIIDENNDIKVVFKGITLKRINAGFTAEPNSKFDNKKFDSELDLSESIINYLKSFISEQFNINIKNIDVTRNFLDLGVDSNDLVRLVKEIENQFSVELYPTLFFEYQNISELSEYFLDNHKEAFGKYFKKFNSKYIEKEIVETDEMKDDFEISEKEFKSRKDTDYSGNNDETIAIIGMAGIFANSPDLNSFWDNLVTQKDLIKEIPTDHFNYSPWFDSNMDAKNKLYCKWGSFIEDVDKFDASFFNISPAEAEKMDPQLRKLLEVLQHTMEDANAGSWIKGSNTGMYVGCCFHDYSNEMEYQGRPVDPYDGSGNALTMQSNRPSFFFDLKGPSLSIDTACSSSLIAIHLACKALRNNECDAAFAAGTNLLLSSWHYRYFSSIKALSPTGRCHTFEKAADGYVPGEGIAAILLKPLSKAIKDGDRIHGTIIGSAINHGGYTPSITAPSMKMEAEVIRKAWADANIHPDTIQYIEAHGTGTKLGDPIEINALKEVFRTAGKQSACYVGSVKSNIGHTEGAAGIAGVIKALLSLKNKVIPAMPFFNELNPMIKSDDSPILINKSNVHWEKLDDSRRRAGVSSFGFGGAYAHILLEEYPEEQRQTLTIENDPLVLLLSANSEFSLLNLVLDLKKYLHENSTSKDILYRIAATLALGRVSHKKRIAIFTQSITDTQEQLKFLSQNFPADFENKILRAEILNNTSDKQLKAIADAWIENKNVDLSKVFKKYFVYDLPFYNFQKNRYWYYKPSINHVTEKSINPLIDSNLSTLAKQKYRKTFSARDVFMKDHVINGKNILPGMVSLEMIRTAGLLAFENDGMLVFSDLIWNSPIGLENDKKTVFVEFEMFKNNVGVKVFSETPENTNYHVNTNIEYTSNTQSSLERIDCKRLIEKTNIKVKGEDCYKKLNDLGLLIGPSLRSIIEIHVSSDYIISCLNIPAASEDITQDYGFHPAILDGSIQSLVGFSLASAQNHTDLNIPYSIKKIRFHKPIPREAYAYIKPFKSDQQDQFFDIKIVDNYGEVLVEFIQLKTHRIDNQINSGLVCFNPIWIPQSLNIEKKISSESKILIAYNSPDDILLQPTIHLLEEKALNYRLINLSESNTDNTKNQIDNFKPNYLFCLYGLNYMENQLLTLSNSITRYFSNIFSLTSALINSNLQLSVINLYQSNIEASFNAYWGTLNKENPSIQLKNILFESPSGISSLIEEMNSFTELYVKYDRKNNRYIREFQEENSHNPVIELFKNNGVYIITGGLGKIGIKILEYISNNFSSNIITIGQTEENEDIGIKLKKLSSQGSNIHYYCCDLSNYSAFSELLEKIKIKFGQINGVIHLAGKTNDKLFRNKKIEDAFNVIAPKINGVLALHEATIGDNLDFFIAASSITGIYGNVGQIDYAFANCFLDEFIKHRQELCNQGKCTGKSIAIDLPYILDGGISIDHEILDHDAVFEMHSLTVLSVLDLLKHPLILSGGQNIIIKGSSRHIYQQKRINKTNPANSMSLKQNEIDSSELQKQLISILAGILKMDPGKISVKTRLTDYGLESISMARFSNEINISFGLHLTPVIFFNIETIHALANYLVVQHNVQLSSHKAEQPQHECVEISRPLSDSLRISASNFKNKISLHHDQRNNQPIAIIGVSGRMPCSANVYEFWENLSNGKDLIREIPKERTSKTYQETSPVHIPGFGGFIDDIDKFDASFFGISPREAELMDPQQRIFLETVWEVIEDAGYKASDLYGSNTGVFLGIGNFDYNDIFIENNVPIEVYLSTGVAHSIAANRISYMFDFKGPSHPIDTACSSSLYAIHYGVEALRSGSCDMVIAGGVNAILNTATTIAFTKAGMLSPDGKCKTFSEDANGYVRGEGTGAILMKPLNKALENNDNIYALILGAAVNHGGATNSLTAPNPQSQAEVIKMAIKNANIVPNSISYIETHGTATKLGDPIEIEGLKSAFRDQLESLVIAGKTIGLGSVKTNIGHLETAAGIASILKVVFALKNKKIPASLNCNKLNPYIELDNTPFYISNKLHDWELCEVHGNIRRAGVSSFGYGGANAHIILEEYIQNKVENYSSFPVFLLSANEKSQLVQSARALIMRIEYYLSNQYPGKEIFNRTAYTLQTGREEKDERIAIVAHSIKDLVTKLNAFIQQGYAEDVYISESGNNQSFFKDWDEMDEIVSKFIEKGNWGKIAQLWINKININWNNLYKNHKPTKISLPTFPFSKEKYWVSSNKEEKLSFINPVIDKNISSLKGIEFEKILSRKDFFMRDHIIDKTPIMPGVVYLEMALSAARLSNPVQEHLRFEKIVWSKSLQLDDNFQKVFINVFPAGNDLSVLISKEKQNNIEECFQARLNVTENKKGEEFQIIDVQSIKEKFNYHIDKESFYNTFNEIGLELGNSFKAIQDINSNDNEMLATYELPEGMQNNFMEFNLHPSIMDAAITSPKAIGGLRKSELYIPFSIETLELLAPIEKNGFIYSKRSDNFDPNANIQKFDIYILNSNGEASVKILNFLPRPIHNQNTTQFLSYDWKLIDQHEQSTVAVKSKCVFLVNNKEQLDELSRIKENINSLFIHKPDVVTFSEEVVYFNGNLQSFQNVCNNDNGIEQLYLLSDINFLLNNHKDTYKLFIDLYSYLSAIGKLLHSLKGKYQKIKWGIIYNTKNGDLPVHGIVWGFISSLSREISILDVTQIELNENSKEFWSKGIIHFILSIGRSCALRFENGNCYKRFLNKATLPVSDTEYITVKRNCTYVIVGGMGKIGSLICHYIADRGGNIAIIGRNPLNTEKRELLRNLEQKNIKVNYYPCDISDLNSAEIVINKIKEDLNNVKGIVHSGAISKDALLFNKSVEEVIEIVSAKLFGCIWLDKHTTGEDLDFFVLFSSLVGSFGNIGQTDYASANSFLDEFVIYRNSLVKEGKRKGKSISIAWPLWKNGGISISDQQKEFFQSVLGMQPITDNEGVQIFETLLKESDNHILAIKGNQEKYQKFINSESVLTTKSKPSIKNDRNDVSMADDLKSIISVVLKIDKSKIDSNKDFSDLGFDSITYTEYANIINEKYGINVSPAEFFENPTLSKFSAHLLSHYQNFKISSSSSAKHSNIKTTIEHHNVDVAFSNKQLPYEKLFSAPGSILTQNANIKYSNKKEDNRVAIIGINAIMPDAENIEAFWDNLEKEKDCIREIPGDRWNWKKYYGNSDKQANKTTAKWGGFMKDVDKFDSRFFNISPKEAVLMDPQHRIFMELTWKTIENAGYRVSDLYGSKTAIFVGVAGGDYSEVLESANYEVDAFSIIGIAHSVLTNRISYYFDWHGPSEPIDTACSSSLVAVDKAVEYVQQNNNECALAGGINVILSPTMNISFSKAGMLSPDGRCKTFDDRANGYVRGEGAGAILLKSYQKALQDGDYIYGVIIGSSVNHGGKANSFTAPNPNSQADVIKDAIQKAGISPETISYIETHGTGTPLGDPVEIQGLKQVFENNGNSIYTNTCKIGSVKTNIGHLEAAAGIASVLKVTLALNKKVIPATLHFNKLNPYINLTNSPLEIVNKTIPWNVATNIDTPRRAGISSFGFGGVNAHIIVEEAINLNDNSSHSNNYPNVFILSAKNKISLDYYVEEIRSYLAKLQDTGMLPDIAYTLQIGREPMKYRLAFFAENIEDAIYKTDQYLKGNIMDNVFYAIAKDDFNSTKNIETSWENINNLIQIWIEGGLIDWQKLYNNHKLKRIPLPTYPFLKSRHWPINQNGTELSLTKLEKSVSVKEDITSICFKCDWEELEFINHQEFNNRNILAITNERSLKMISYIKSILPEIKLAGYKDILDGNILLSGYDHILFLSGIQSVEERIENVEFLKQSKKEGINTLFKLINDLRKDMGINQNIRFTVVSNNLFKLPCDKQQQVSGGNLLGFVNSISKEYQNIQFAFVDIDEAEISESIAGQILCLDNINETGAIALRMGRRFVRKLYPITLTGTKGESFRHRGTYAIIGGMGGVGLELAKYLAKTYQANMLLIGRRKDLKNDQLSEIEQIKASGSNVQYFSADIGNETELLEALQKGKDLFGSINGIIHSAIVLKDMLLKDMTEDNLESVMYPKVEGSVNVYKLGQFFEVDFLLFFSSLLSFAGNAGQSNYSAGCSFKDQMALFASGKGLKAKVINWGYWGNVGIVSGKEYQDKMKSSGIFSIEVEEGMMVIEDILKSSVNQIFVIKGEKQVLQHIGVDYSEEIRFVNQTRDINCISNILDSGVSDQKADLIQVIGDGKDFQELNTYCHIQLLKVFQSCDLFCEENEKYTTNEIEQKLKLSDKYHDLLEELLDILVQHNYLIESNGQFTSTNTVESIKTYQYKIINDLVNVYPKLRGYSDLLDACTKQYSKILSGDIKATEVIFPESSMHLVDNIYSGNNFADFFNKECGRLMKWYVQKVKRYSLETEKIRILEIGAGTGGTTKFLLKELKEFENDIEFVYTDISESFIRYGRKNFEQEIKNIKFKVLDIENFNHSNVKDQGKFDIVIGSNVFHATKKIRQTLRNTKQFLKENGIIILNEMVRKDDYTTLTFGLLDGWWAFEDKNSRLKGCPLLSVDLWKRALQEEGFKNVHELIHDKETQTPQNVIVAESNGEIKLKLAIHTQKPDPLKNNNSPICEKPQDTFSTNLKLKDIENKVIQIISRIINVNAEDLDMETPFSEFGIDSILTLEVIKELNNELGIQLRPTELYSNANITMLARKIVADYNLTKQVEIIKEQSKEPIKKLNEEYEYSNLLSELTELYNGKKTVDEVESLI